MEKQFRAQLLTSIDDGVPVGWAVAPRNQTGRRIVLWRVGLNSGVAVEGTTGQSSALIQVDIYGDTYKEAYLLHRQVRAGMDGFSGGFIQGCFLNSVRDSVPASDIKDAVFRMQLDYSVNFREPAPV